MDHDDHPVDQRMRQECETAAPQYRLAGQHPVLFGTFPADPGTAAGGDDQGNLFRHMDPLANQ